jgi:hypothetical protein
MSSNYSEIRDSIRTGDLVSWKAGKVTSFFGLVLYLYQKILKPKSVHVGIVMTLGGRLFVVEARPPAVRIFPLSCMDDFYLVRTNIPFEQNNIDFLLKEIGVPYGVIDLILGIANLYNDKDQVYCSELCDIYYKEIKYLPEDKESTGSNPDQLLEAVIEKSGSKPIYVKIDRGNFHAI